MLISLPLISHNWYKTTVFMFKNTDHVNFTLIKILLQQYPREITNTVK